MNEIKLKCPKCGARVFHKVWMSTCPQRCSNCGYTEEKIEIIC